MLFPFANRADEIALRQVVEKTNPKTGMKPIDEHLQREMMIDRMIVRDIGLEGGTQEQINAIKNAYKDVPFNALRDEFLSMTSRRPKKILARNMDLQADELFNLSKDIQEASNAITSFMSDPTLAPFRDSPYGEATMLQLRARYDKLIDEYETTYNNYYGENQ